jgi:hypothetical protein
MAAGQVPHREREASFGLVNRHMRFVTQLKVNWELAVGNPNPCEPPAARLNTFRFPPV